MTTTQTQTMLAWAQTAYGGPDAVAAARVDVPAPRAGAVLVRVDATSLNSGDVRVMRGEPLLLRLVFGLRRPKTPTPGRDVAGTVVALGDGVADLAVGDRVVGELTGAGGLAEHVVAPVSELARIPDGLDSVTAATLPIAGGTAWQALDAAAVASGHRVLVVGAGGGVGTFAVRLAALRGAEVDALCGARAEPVVADLGAARTWDYREVGLADLPQDAYDAVIDVAGAVPLRALQGLARDGGTVVLVNGGEHRVFGPLGRMARGAVLSIGSRRRIRPLAAAVRPSLTAELAALAAAGELVPHVERTWPLAEARAALAHVDAGRTVGKVVVTAS